MPAPTQWFDEPALLIHDFEETQASRAHPIGESRTYAEMLFARPGNTVRLGPMQFVFNAAGLREQGFNSFAEAVEGAVSQVVRPLKAKVTPVGGTWKMKRTCEALGQLIDGSLEASNFSGIASALVWDGMWAPEGFAVLEDDGRGNARFTRMDPLNSFVSSDGKEFKTRRAIPRREVLRRYGKTPELIQIIKDLDRWSPEPILGADADGMFSTEDTVSVWEGWYEALADIDKGCHTVQLRVDAVISEPWPYPVPIVRFHWSHGIRGPADGIPLGRAIAPLMATENQMHLKVTDAIAASVPMVFGKKDPKLSNAPFQFVHEDAEDDQVGTVRVTVPDVVSQPVLDRAEYVRERIRARTGVSESTTAGEPPPQYKSGIALQRYIGLVHKRLSQQNHNHLQLYKDAARLITILGPKIWSSKAKIAAADGTSVINQIDWNDVILPEDAYRLSFDVVSDLPDQIPTKDELLEIVKDLGIMDAVELLANLNTPDYLRRVEILTGPRNYVEFQIDRALDDGIIEPPNDMQDKAALAKSAADQWQAARAAKVRPDPSHMDALWLLWELAATQQPPPPATADVPPTAASEAEPLPQ